MNKDVKFRFWLKDEKKMYGVSELQFSSESVVCCNLGTKERPYFYADYKDVVLMFGLKIYDEVVFVGDVIRIYGGEQMFGYYEFDKTKVIKKIEDLLMLFNMDCGIEILGNIYENPELLEVEQCC